MIDLLETDSLLQLELKVAYTRSLPKFYLLTDETTRSNTYVFEIKRIGLQVPIVRVNDSLLPEIKSLTTKEPGRYHFRSLTCKQYNLPSETEIYTSTKIFTPQIPQRLILGIYKQTAFAGHAGLSPFFTSSDVQIRSIKLKHDGMSVREIIPKFEKGQYIRLYTAFLNFLNVGSDKYMIDHLDYLNGHR